MYFGSQNRAKNERDYIQMKMNEQNQDKKRNQERKKIEMEEFSKYANKDRLESVNVFLPSKVGL